MGQDSEMISRQHEDVKVNDDPERDFSGIWGSSRELIPVIWMRVKKKRWIWLLWKGRCFFPEKEFR